MIPFCGHVVHESGAILQDGGYYVQLENGDIVLVTHEEWEEIKAQMEDSTNDA